MEMCNMKNTLTLRFGIMKLDLDLNQFNLATCIGVWKRKKKIDKKNIARGDISQIYIKIFIIKWLLDPPSTTWVKYVDN